MYDSNESLWLEQIDKWYKSVAFKKENSFLSYNVDKENQLVDWCIDHYIQVSPTIIVDDMF